MLKPEDLVFALLVSRLRNVAAERMQALLAQVRKGGGSVAEAAAAQGMLFPADVPAYQEAARYLIAGNCLQVCATCRSQVVSARAPRPTCPGCGAAFLRGVIPVPQNVVFDGELERHLRRLILDVLARNRTQANVAEARRLRDAGKIGQRPEAELAPKDRLCAGTVLGDFKLLELIGRGSSSWVFRAEDAREGRTVALKVLHLQDGEPPARAQEKLARFQREAELASRLDHPNLVSAGKLEQAGPWYCLPMSLVDGPTLAQLLEARQAAATAGAAPAAGTDLESLTTALADVARGLHYAHCHGVVHRDVNPRNILFASSGQAFLGDFGVAKPVDSESLLTAAKTVLGTLGYVAPERLQSEGNADARSDIYSLGAVLYEILTGRLPYPVTNAMVLLTRILQGAPEAPRTLNPQVPPPLERVALKALEADPTRRYPSALEFAHALDVSGGDEETVIVAPGEVPSPGAAVGLARPAGATGAGAVPGVAGEAAGRASAQAPSAAAAAQPAPGRAVARLRVVAVAAVGFTVGAAAMSLTTGHDGPDLPALLTAARSSCQTMAAARTDADYRAASDACRRALDAAERPAAADDLAILSSRGWFAWSQGEVREAEQAFGRAATIGGVDDQTVLAHGLSAYLMAQRYGASERSKRYEEAAEVALDRMRRQAGSARDRKLASALLALLHKEVDSAHEDFLALAREDRDHPWPPFLAGWSALAARAPDAAGGSMEGAAGRHPRDPYLQLVRGLARLGRGKAEEALAIAQGMRALWPRMVEAALLEGMALLQANHPAAALAALSQARELDPYLPQVYRGLAAVHARTGDPCRAIAELSLALDLEPNVAETLYQRGRLLWEHGDAARARADLQTYLQRNPTGERAEEVRALLKGG